MALIQLGKRTASEPGADYVQMIKEDILQGVVNGESLRSFLPDDLVALLPGNSLSDKEDMGVLKSKLGALVLIERLKAHFYTLGQAGEIHAAESWKKLGLDSKLQAKIGLALQKLLEKIDIFVESKNLTEVTGKLAVSNELVSFKSTGSQCAIAAETAVKI